MDIKKLLTEAISRLICNVP